MRILRFLFAGADVAIKIFRSLFADADHPIVNPIKRVPGVKKHLNLLDDKEHFQLANLFDKKLNERAAELKRLAKNHKLQLQTYKRINSGLHSHPTSYNLAALDRVDEVDYQQDIYGIARLFKSARRIRFSDPQIIPDKKLPQQEEYLGEHSEAQIKKTP